MIASLTGTVAALGLDHAVLEVGGVGLACTATPATLATLRVGESAHLATSLVVREDSLTLFGFAEDDERDVFEVLQTVSGVGPRLALAVLAVLYPFVESQASAWIWWLLPGGVLLAAGWVAWERAWARRGPRWAWPRHGWR